MVDILGVTYMTEKEASRRYHYSSSWFQRARTEKKSPPYIKFQGRGRIYYPVSETDNWFRERMERSEQ